MCGSVAPADPRHAVGSWRIDHVDLRLELGMERVAVRSMLQVRRNPGAAVEPLVLDGVGLDLQSVRIDGTDVSLDSIERADRTLTLHLDGDAHEVTIANTCAVRGVTDLGFTRRPTVLSTVMEPEGFRRITWFLDRPSNRAVFDVTLVGDPSVFPVMLCNGHEVGRATEADGRVAVRFHDPMPKPTYLFAVAAGELELRSATHTTASGRTIELRVAATADEIGGADYALRTMAAAMAFDEADTGIEHTLDVLTFVALHGYPDATEYHGLMFFDSAVLVVDTTGHTDDDLLLISANIAHEYGHQVRGNRFTVRTWPNLALKEGLTVLAQNAYREHMFGPMSRVLDVLDLRRLQFPEEITMSAPVVREASGDPATFYTRTTYLKGAEVFRMLRTVMGDERYASAFRTFVHRFDLGSATVDDFVSVASECAPEVADDIAMVALWFHRRGRPAVRVSTTIGADGSSSLALQRTDSLDGEPPVGIPVIVGFHGPDGTPVAGSIDGGPAAVEHVLLLRGRDALHRVGTEVPATVSTFLRYSAPIDIADDTAPDRLATVMCGATDPYARWWASEELMIRAIDAHRHGNDAGATALVELLGEALGRVLVGERDVALLAQLLALPDEFMLGDREARIDVDGVASGLTHLRATLGARLHDPLLDALDRHATDRADGTEPGDIAARMLIDPLFSLLLATGSDESLRAAHAQVDSANATRAIRAFGQLAHLEQVDLGALIAATEPRYAGAPKLLDRWLRAQTGSRRVDTIARVEAMVTDPRYDRNDRGRVMALWFPFATRNRSVFHHPSGEGYRVFVDEVGVLMGINPGLVIRLVGDLLQFRRFDDHRSALMRAQIERMAEMPGMPDFAVGILRNLLQQG